MYEGARRGGILHEKAHLSKQGNLKSMYPSALKPAESLLRRRASTSAGSFHHTIAVLIDRTPYPLEYQHEDEDSLRFLLSSLAAWAGPSVRHWSNTGPTNRR